MISHWYVVYISAEIPNRMDIAGTYLYLVNTRSNQAICLQDLNQIMRWYFGTSCLLLTYWKKKFGKSKRGKISHFLWQIQSEAVAVNERLFKRHIGNDPSYPRCGHAEETINHMIFTCPPAMQCWAFSTVPTAPGVFPSENLYTNINYLLASCKD